MQGQMIHGNNSKVHLYSLIYHILSDLTHIILIGNLKSLLIFLGHVISQIKCLKPRDINNIYTFRLRSPTFKANQ